MPSSTARTRAGAQRIAERERTFRIIQTQLDRGIDVRRRGNSQFSDVGAHIDDHRKQTLHHETRAVVDHSHWHTAD